jgi:hypothetical protein
MNKFQRLVMTVAIIDVIVMVMVPPFADRPLARNMLPSFDGFYPIFSKLGQLPVHRDLLSMQFMFVAINALLAWLALQVHHKDDFRTCNYARAIAIFAAGNIAVMLLFPPFEQYSSLLRPGPSSFDSFYFIVGARSARPIFTPLLYIEIIFVLINALAIYLLFNAVQRSEDARRSRLFEMADQMDEAELSTLSDQMRALIDEHRSRNMLNTLGRKRERRLRDDPDYRGPERRSGQERRHPR